MTTDKRQELLDIRRDLISAIRNLERTLGIPPDKSAIRTRQERRQNVTIVTIDERNDVMVR